MCESILACAAVRDFFSAIRESICLIADVFNSCADTGIAANASRIAKPGRKLRARAITSDSELIVSLLLLWKRDLWRRTVIGSKKRVRYTTRQGGGSESGHATSGRLEKRGPERH